MVSSQKFTMTAAWVFKVNKMRRPKSYINAVLNDISFVDATKIDLKNYIFVRAK